MNWDSWLYPKSKFVVTVCVKRYGLTTFWQNVVIEVKARGWNSAVDKAINALDHDYKIVESVRRIND